jgi:oxygen-independent coproporphyrinogen-3 oxidase
MFEAMLKEIELRQEELKSEPIKTIYFGGGTPSLIPSEHISELIAKIKTHANVLNTAEITLEANPEDVNESKLTNWKAGGVNRLSIGIQTFDDNCLKWMNREHTGQMAIEAVKLAYKMGFENISIDIISGIPVAEKNQNRKDLEQACQLPVKHISCYSLTLEPQTSWEKLIHKKDFPGPKEEVQAKELDFTSKYLTQKGWIQYELSNYAFSQAWFSRHNSSYWKGELYTGIGPSAHSYNKNERRWNTTSHTEYINALNQGYLPEQNIEILTPVMRFNELIMTRIRTKEGIDLNQMNELLPYSSGSLLYKSGLPPLNDWVLVKNNHLILTQKGKLFADRVSSILFID